jgi:hypothetical protein
MSALEKHVSDWLEERAEDYESGVEGVISDLMQGGCQSGMVGHLIYYKDTCAFYKEHQSEISDLLKEMLQDTGCEGPGALFGDKWDNDDPLANEDLNQNLLAWFGFEETAMRLAQRRGIEI